MSGLLEKTLWNVPYQRNPFFTGREDILDCLHRALYAEQRVALSQPQGITGLGGIGKTQTVVEYAYRHREEYNAVLWVRADSIASLTTSMAELAQVLHLSERNEQDQEVIVQAVLRWFRVNTDWLLIYDNIDDLSLAERFLPKARPGHLLFTTRAHSLGGLAQRLDIQQMEPEVGALLLLRRANLLAIQAMLNIANPDDQRLARAISQELDGLPLALDQAGAYIKEAPCPLAGYLAHYQTRRQRLLGTRGDSNQNYAESVETTWSLSFEKVSEANPAAAELLNFCAFLAPETIPEELFITGSSHLGSILATTTTNPVQFDLACKEALRFSLIAREADLQSLSMHRLVQAVLRDTLSPQICLTWKSRAVSAVSAAFPDSSDAGLWTQCERLSSHALVCADWVAQESLNNPEAPHLLNELGFYLLTRARYSEAGPLLQQALKVSEAQLEADYFELTQSLHNLTIFYHKVQGKLTEAEASTIRALAIYQQQFGAEPPGELLSLAGIYTTQGKFGEAEQLLLRALAMGEQYLGTEHLFTAVALNNLAGFYIYQGAFGQQENLVKAEPLIQRALKIYEQEWGNEHVGTAEGFNTLAQLYYYQGKYAEAEQSLERVLTIQEQLFGKDHLDTASTLNNLAVLYTTRGKYVEAEPLFLRTLTVYKQLLAPGHPNIATCLDSLAGLYENQGKYAAAEAFYRQALAIREKHLGPSHPSTALILNNLAVLYGKQKKAAKAKPLLQRAQAILEEQSGTLPIQTAICLTNLGAVYLLNLSFSKAGPLLKRALAIFEEQLGSEHPSTALCLGHIAFIYDREGDHDEGEFARERALAIFEKQLGPEHPLAVSMIESLAICHMTRGRFREAKRLSKRALTILEQGFDGKHPLIGVIRRHYIMFTVMQIVVGGLWEKFFDHWSFKHQYSTNVNNIAIQYEKLGKYEKAEQLYLRSLALSEAHLETEHLDTVTTLNNLAMLYENQGKHIEAEPLYVRALAISERQLGAEHPDTASGLNNLAEVYRVQEKYEEAEPLYQRALAIVGRALGAEHPTTQIFRKNYVALLKSKMPDEAAQEELLLQPDLEIRKPYLPRNRTDTNNTEDDKFTEQARKVFSVAQEEAQRFQHYYVGPEHLLLGLVQEGEGAAAKVLSDLGVELNKARRAVEFVVGHGDRMALGEVGLTPRAERVIELAADEARLLNHYHIGTEHLLLGLIREGGSIATGVLEALNVSLEEVRRLTIQVLANNNI